MLLGFAADQEKLKLNSMVCSKVATACTGYWRPTRLRILRCLRGVNA